MASVGKACLELHEKLQCCLIRLRLQTIFTSTDLLDKKIRQLAKTGMFDREIAETLNKEHSTSARGVPLVRARDK